MGRIGSEGRLDYTAVGNVVNLASHLCDSAEENQILVDHVAAVALDARDLKGFDLPVPVFAVNA